MQLYFADFVAPMTGPVLRDGWVLVEAGRIAAVGQRRSLPRVAAARTDLGRCLLTPGLINAHTHTNLSFLAGAIPPGPFWPWLVELVRRRRAGGSGPVDPALELRGAVDAARAALALGTTTLADMHYLPDVRSALAATALRQVACSEFLSIGRAAGADTQAWLAECVGSRWRGAKCLPAIAPHAPYTVHADVLRAAAQAAVDYDLPLVAHWAETPEEVAWLDRGDGAVAAALAELDARLPLQLPPSPRQRPIAYARALGLLDAGVMLVHGNALSPADLAALAEHEAQPQVRDDGTWRPLVSVCYCPRTHDYFGMSDHPWLALLEGGVNVCVGTDSLASLPAGATLAPIEELRFLRRRHPQVDPLTLWRLATANAANALKLRGHLGVLDSGAEADLVAWPLSPAEAASGDSLAAVLDGRQSPVRVMVGGAWVEGERAEPATTR